VWFPRQQYQSDTLETAEIWADFERCIIDRAINK